MLKQTKTLVKTLSPGAGKNSEIQKNVIITSCKTAGSNF
jgi:hypothetical protein